MRYAAVSVTDFYGPKTDHAIISLHVDLNEAKEVAEGHAPDYDSKVDAHRLRNNQASPTRGEVWTVAGYYDEREEVEDGQIICIDPDTDEVLILAPLVEPT